MVVCVCDRQSWDNTFFTAGLRLRNSLPEDVESVADNILLKTEISFIFTITLGHYSV